MIGSWRWNAAIGGIGAALTFLISLGNNPLAVTFMRSLIAFVLFGLMALAVRYILGVLLLPASRPDPEEFQEEEVGARLDFVTPGEENSLTDLMKENWSGGKESPIAGFEPLRPKRVAALDNPDPDEVVKAIRSLTDE